MIWCEPYRDEEDGILVAKEAAMEKRKVQEAVSAWQAEKRRRVEDGEKEEGGADDEDVQDVQVQQYATSLCVPVCCNTKTGQGLDSHCCCIHNLFFCL